MRKADILRRYLSLIEKHLYGIVNGEAEKMYEIEDFAKNLFIHPTHLSNTVQEYSGISACGVYQINILKTAFKLLSDQSIPIKEIALTLTFSPTQFSKWFKRYMGITPRQFRAAIISNSSPQLKSEMVNIFSKYDQLLLKLQTKDALDE